MGPSREIPRLIAPGVDAPPQSYVSLPTKGTGMTVEDIESVRGYRVCQRIQSLSEDTESVRGYRGCQRIQSLS